MSVPAAYIGVIVIWSTTPLAIQWSAETVGPVFGLTARMTIGTVLSLLLLAATRVPLPWTRRAVYSYAAAALSLYGGMMGAYWAAQHLPSGLISVLFGLAPLITGALGMLWLNQRLAPHHIFGTLLGLAGLALIFRADLSDYPQAWRGIAVLLVAVTLYAGSMVLVKRSGAELHPLAQSTGGLLLAMPCYLLTWLLIDGGAWPATIPPRAAVAIAYLAVFGSVVGFVLYYYLLKALSTNAVALITLITPVLALQLGQFINGELVPPAVWLGTAVVIGGLALHQWGGGLRVSLRRRERPVSPQR